MKEWIILFADLFGVQEVNLDHFTLSMSLFLNAQTPEAPGISGISGIPGIFNEMKSKANIGTFSQFVDQ